MTMHRYTKAERAAMREAKRQADEEWRRKWDYDRRIYAWTTSRGIALTPGLEKKLREVLDAQE